MVATQRIAIQGELGSNSHLAARGLLGEAISVLPCRHSSEVFQSVEKGFADGAVLPIENSLHGSVADHYDLLLHSALRITGEYNLRIEHHLIAAPGVRLESLREVLSHPVALSQCRRFLAAHAHLEAQPFYDTAGSVAHVVGRGLTYAAGIAPRLAAEIYGGDILIPNVEDHRENFTRFHLLRPDIQSDVMTSAGKHAVNKLTAAFSIEHRPGSLVRVLDALANAGADLTRIESRPVPGKPWEYVFFVDLRFAQDAGGAEMAFAALRSTTGTVRELGRYAAAGDRHTTS